MDKKSLLQAFRCRIARLHWAYTSKVTAVYVTKGTKFHCVIFQ